MVRKPKPRDSVYDHCDPLLDSDGKAVRNKHVCKYCNKIISSGVTRVKHHLAHTHIDIAPCTKNSDEVRDFFAKQLEDLKENKEGGSAKFDSIHVLDDDEDIDETSEGLLDRKGKGKIDSFFKGKQSQVQGKKQLTMNTMIKDREPVVRDICRFLYKNALAFNLVKCPTFKQMIKSVGGYGRGLKPPYHHEARVTYLKKEVDSVNVSIERYKEEWKRTGCTLMSDGWSDGRGRSITNFLVNSPSGTVFLRSVDTSDISKNADNLFELLNMMVKEVGIDSVVQVVTDSASAYVNAGKRLMDEYKHIFWSPCAAHCLDLMLSDIGALPVHDNTITKARRITVYIYRHSWVLCLMRKFTKGRDLTRPAVTRFATSYLTLKSILENRQALKSMFASEEWASSSFARKNDGKGVESIVLMDSLFWKGVKYCCLCVIPLVKVLRMVDGDGKPPIGYIYEAMDAAKEKIQKNFKGVESRYKEIWNIIDDRWNMQLHRPLHAAAYFLNPKYFYDPKREPCEEVDIGLYEVLERMCPSIRDRLHLDKQLDTYRNAEGMFKLDMAVELRDKKHPARWWQSYGTHVKELQRIAIRILSLTCSASGCERNWSTFDIVHSKRRNKLEQARVNALVFVKYNINLQLRQTKRESEGDTYDPIYLSDMDSDDEWITETEERCLPYDETWLDVNQCFSVEEENPNKRNKRGPRNLNAPRKSNAKDKGKASTTVLVDEDDDEDGEEEEGQNVELDDDDIVAMDGDDDLDDFEPL